MFVLFKTQQSRDISLLSMLLYCRFNDGSSHSYGYMDREPFAQKVLLRRRGIAPAIAIAPMMPIAPTIRCRLASFNVARKA